ncbi:MAG: murein biosynthesis integral membrane protein MurJ [Candidatus Moranbacteria bacterium]|nr:murein biosynthesis integral membrane protein MurJ [Candidatus Moranbacteria bacterium]MDD3964806.1 murein biosynthesis integral membrane protein MurJ [Candidatus Moranbacteria bacterium]
MVRKWYNNFSSWTLTPSKTVGSAALLIALAGIVSRILGFFRDRILASQFGAGDVLDAYYAAFRIPDLLYSLLVLGALSAAFIPVFTELVAEKKQEEAWRLTSGVLQLLFLVLGSLSLLGIIFAPMLIPLITPGFSREKTDIVILLTRVMLLSPIFLSVSAVFGSVLVSFKQFVAYSLAPIFYNVGIIIGAVLFVPFFGPVGLAWGVVMGSMLHMTIQYPSLKKSGFRFVLQPFIFWRDPTVRKVVRLMIPRSLGLAVSQMSLFTMTIFASTLASGSLAVFTLANNIQSVPLGLFGIAFSVAVFPSLAFFSAKKKEKDFFVILSQTSTRILFFVVPISMFMVLFRAQFVRVILGAGQFDWEDTILTFETLEILALSLFAQSLIPLFARAFFALQDTKTPFYIALVSAGVQIALIPFFLPAYSVLALALAFSLSNVLNVILLYLFLRSKLTFWNDREFFLPIIKIIFATLGAGIIAQISKSVFALTIDELDTFAKVFFQLCSGIAIGGVSFLVFCHWLGVEELGMVKRFILCKILRQPETATVAEDHPERGDW